MCHSKGTSKVMACHQMCAKPLSKLMLLFGPLGPIGTLGTYQVKSKYKFFYQQNAFQNVIC